MRSLSLQIPTTPNSKGSRRGANANKTVSQSASMELKPTIEICVQIFRKFYIMPFWEASTKALVNKSQELGSYVRNQNSATSESVQDEIQKHIHYFADHNNLEYYHPDFFKDFNLDSNIWSNANAVAMARLSILSYRSKEAIDKYLDEANIHESERLHIDNKETDTQAFCCATDKLIAVAFRGTESRKDVIVDLNRKRTPMTCGSLNFGTVHSGFKWTFDSVWEEIEEFVAKRGLDRHRRVWVTGHSLGGALATLAAAKIGHLNGQDTIGGLYTFGQPRVGDHAFKAAAINAIGAHKIFRVYRNADPVPMVPRWRYKHVSGTHRCYISRSGKFHLGGGPLRKWGERLVTWGGLAYKVTTLRGRFSDLKALVSDHNSRGYLSALRAAHGDELDKEVEL